jgi:hypothetical protein
LSPASVPPPPDGSGVRPTPGARRPLPRLVAVLLTVAAVILTGGLAIVAAGGAPLALVLAVTWWRPERAVPILAVLIAGVIVLSVWAAISSEAWRAFEDRNGPLRTVLVWAVGAPVALLGLRPTALAGWMLLVLGVVPMVLARGASSARLWPTPP